MRVVDRPGFLHNFFSMGGYAIMYEARWLKECLENVSPPPHSPSAQNKGSLPMGRGGMNVGWDQGRMEVGQELGGGGGQR